MNFRIGKIAKLLSMSSEGLRLYERSGIIKPQRDDGDNSYRTYEHLDFTALIRARGYHYAGFSTKEISHLLNAKCVDDIIAGYETREKVLEQEIDYKKQLLQNLRSLKSISANAEHKLWKIEKKVRPAMYRFPFISDGNYLLDSKQEKIFTKWLQKTPFVFISQSIEWEKLLSGTAQITAALGIFEEQLSFLSLDLEYAQYYPSCSCLYSIVQEQGADFQPFECFYRLIEYVDKNSIIVTGSPVSRTFLSMNKNENYTRYREIWIPVEE